MLSGSRRARDPVPPTEGTSGHDELPRGPPPATRRRVASAPRHAIHNPVPPLPSRRRQRSAGEDGPPPLRRRALTEEGGGTGHAVVVTGPIAWCTRCARYAHQRTGRGLAGSCDPLARGATPRRLDLLAQGRHPITGTPLVE